MNKILILVRIIFGIILITIGHELFHMLAFVLCGHDATLIIDPNGVGGNWRFMVISTGFPNREMTDIIEMLAGPIIPAIVALMIGLRYAEFNLFASISFAYTWSEIASYLVTIGAGGNTIVIIGAIANFVTLLTLVLLYLFKTKSGMKLVYSI